MENRYTGIIERENARLAELCPAHQVLRLVVAYELKKASLDNPRILDLGCGEGFSALPILKHTNYDIDLLDVNPKMLSKAKKNLEDYADRVNFIQEDGLRYLQKCKPYDVITSSWTIHNFPWKDKSRLFEEIYKKLNSNGAFLLMDKVYPDDTHGESYLFNSQMRRFRYLEKPVSAAMIKHELRDSTVNYKMNQSQVMNKLMDSGFLQVSLIDRVEREVVILAIK